MKYKITLLLFSTLLLASCGDSGESTFDPSVLPTVDEPGDFLGNGGTGGIEGEVPDSAGVDLDELPTDATDVDLMPVEDIATPVEDVVTPVDGVTTIDDDAIVEDTDGGVVVEDTITTVPPAPMGTGGLFLLPGDCILADGENGMQFCISEAAGSRLFAVDQNGSLIYSATLSEQGSNSDPLVIGGVNAFVVRQSVANPSTRVLTSFDESGNELYEALLSGDLVTIVDGIVEDPNLFLHTTNSFGDSTILQIDSATGRQDSVLNLPGATVENLAVESFDGITALSLVQDGVTVFYDIDTLEQITRIFALDPTTFQTAFSTNMQTMRADYLFDFETILNASVAMFDVAGEATEMLCPGGGSITLPVENSVVSSTQFTRSFQYDDCDINGVVVNGSMQNSLFNIQTLNGLNGSETWDLQNMNLSRELGTLDANGEPVLETKTVNASVSNIFVFTIDNLFSERSMVVDGFSQTFAGEEIFSVTNASYSRTMTTDSPNVPTSGFQVSEVGSLVIMNGEIETIMSIDVPLIYLDSGVLNEVSAITDPPISGTVMLEASDGSNLLVDASRGGVNLQNYFITQRGAESTLDAIWTVPTLSTTIGIFN